MVVLRHPFSNSVLQQVKVEQEEGKELYLLEVVVEQVKE
jgi:hypothetical protein